MRDRRSAETRQRLPSSRVGFSASHDERAWDDNAELAIPAAMVARADRRLASIAMLVAACVVLAPACEASRGPRWRGYGAREPRRGGTLTTSTFLEVRTLDPAIANDDASIFPLAHLYDTLVALPVAAGWGAGAGEVVPQLAASYEISRDGRTYAFTLREGLRFSNGRAVVAADVAYALRRVLRMPDSPFRALLDGIAGATAYGERARDEVPGIRAMGDRRLELELVEPDAAFLQVLTMRFATPLAEEFVAAHDGDLRAAALGTGPFVLASLRDGEEIVLERNARYWDPRRPLLERIEVRQNVDRDMAFLAFEAGELDVIDRPGIADWQWIATRDDWRSHVHRIAQLAVFGARINVARPPFDDPRIRQALNFAVDQSSVAKVLGGLAVPAHGMLPPGLAGRDGGLAPYPLDRSRARSLLASAGYRDGFDVEYATVPDDTAAKVAALLQRDLAAVGIRVRITQMSWPVYLAATARRDGPALAMASWLADYPDPSNFIDLRFHSRMISEAESANDSFYASAEVDRAIDEARRALDPDARAALYRRIERLLHDDAPWIWGYHPETVAIVQPYVKGFALHPLSGVTLRDVWLDLDPDGRRITR